MAAPSLLTTAREWRLAVIMATARHAALISSGATLGISIAYVGLRMVRRRGRGGTRIILGRRLMDGLRRGVGFARALMKRFDGSVTECAARGVNLWASEQGMGGVKATSSLGGFSFFGYST
jgi:hypothetical protein